MFSKVIFYVTKSLVTPFLYSFSYVTSMDFSTTLKFTVGISIVTLGSFGIFYLVSKGMGEVDSSRHPLLPDEFRSASDFLEAARRLDKKVIGDFNEKIDTCVTYYTDGVIFNHIEDPHFGRGVLDHLREQLFFNSHIEDVFAITRLKNQFSLLAE